MATPTMVADANHVKKPIPLTEKNELNNRLPAMNPGMELCRVMDIGAVDAKAVKKAPQIIEKNDLNNPPQSTTSRTANLRVTGGAADAKTVKEPTELLPQSEDTVFLKILLNKF